MGIEYWAAKGKNKIYRQLTPFISSSLFGSVIPLSFREGRKKEKTLDVSDVLQLIDSTTDMRQEMECE
jgi:hypothetical protein